MSDPEENAPQEPDIGDEADDAAYDWETVRRLRGDDNRRYKLFAGFVMDGAAALVVIGKQDGEFGEAHAHSLKDHSPKAAWLIERHMEKVIGEMDLIAKNSSLIKLYLGLQADSPSGLAPDAHTPDGAE